MQTETYKHQIAELLILFCHHSFIYFFIILYYFIFFIFCFIFLFYFILFVYFCFLEFPLARSKVQQVVIGERLTFSKAFSYANEHLLGRTVILGTLQYSTYLFIFILFFTYLDFDLFCFIFIFFISSL